MPPDDSDKSTIGNRQSTISAPPGEPAGAIAGQFLKFIGLLVTVGGALAIVRLRHNDELSHTMTHSLFYAILMPIGVVIWLLGFYLVGKFPPPPGSVENSAGKGGGLGGAAKSDSSGHREP